MKRFLQGLACALVLLTSYGVSAQFINGGGFYDAIEQYISGSGVASGDINLGTHDLISTPATGATCIYDASGATCGTRTDDANGDNRTISTSNVWPFAAAAKVPGKLIARGGCDSKTFNVLSGLAGCTAADTAIATYSVNGATATVTTCTYGTDWCSGVGADTCANATEAAVRLALCLDAGAGISASVSGATCPGGAVNARCVGVTADSGTACPVLTQNDATCTVLSNGTNGSVDVGTSAASVETVLKMRSFNVLSFADDSTSSVWAASPYTLNTPAAWYAATYIASSGGFAWLSSTYIKNNSDGKLAIAKAAGTGAGFDVTTDNRISLTKADGTTLGEFSETMWSAVITLNNSAAQTIFTVPAGFTFVPTKLIVRNPSGAVTATDAGGWGGDANCTNYKAAVVFGAQLTSTSAVVAEYPATNVGYLTYAAATAFCYKLTAADASATTVTMSVFGYLR